MFHSVDEDSQTLSSLGAHSLRVRTLNSGTLTQSLSSLLLASHVPGHPHPHQTLEDHLHRPVMGSQPLH